MVTWTGIARFTHTVLHLQSFPVFCAYLALIPLAKLWQQKTKPLDLKPVLVVYNFVCSLLSLVTLVGFGYGLYRADFVYQKSPTPELHNIYFLYWVTKNIELLDTVFMILRHRRRQLTFLHVYHHASMLLLSDYSYRLAAWPAIAPILALNSLVHVFLYFYYGLTAYNPSQTPAWKQRLTELQIIQFWIDLVYAYKGYVSHGFCVYGFMYGFVMIVLFTNFYVQAYVLKKTRKPKPDVYMNGTANGKSD